MIPNMQGSPLWAPHHSDSFESLHWALGAEKLRQRLCCWVCPMGPFLSFLG